MDHDERSTRAEAVLVEPEAVRAVAVRLRLPDATPDEAAFFLASIVAGAFCGYLFAIL